MEKMENKDYFNMNSPMGGGFGGFGSGIGGFGLFGLIGLLNNRRGGILGGDDCGDGAGAAAVLAAIANSKDTTVAEGRGLAAAICESEKSNLNAFYAAAIQAANNTSAVKDAITTQSIVLDKRFDDLAAAGVAQTAAIIAKLNQTEIDSLRDQLAASHRHSAHQDITISIQNSNAQLQAQLQAQAQVQAQKDFDHVRRFDSLVSSFAQLNKATSDVINFGTMAASANQANTQQNAKS